MVQRNVKDELKTTKALVEQFLRIDEQCRNSDEWLIYNCLQHIAKLNGQKIFIPFQLFQQFPARETITRVRRHFQNTKGLYLPTNPEIIRKRGLKEKTFHKEFSKKDEALEFL